MLPEIIIRFIIGGLVVSAFAVIGDVLTPKSFAGIFGAAPSIALATLGLAFIQSSPTFVATEGRSMLLGAAALLAYCLAVSWLFTRDGHHAVLEVSVPWLLWIGVAFGLWAMLLR